MSPPVQVGFAYLASPYTHSDPLVREERYLRTMKVLADRLKRGEWTYSPIVHCHELAKTFRMPVEHDFWLDYDRTMILAADRFLVLRLEDWELSRGIKSEIEYALQVGKRVEYI